MRPKRMRILLSHRLCSPNQDAIRNASLCNQNNFVYIITTYKVAQTYIKTKPERKPCVNDDVRVPNETADWEK